jgi:hypothetical protein
LARICSKNWASLTLIYLLLQLLNIMVKKHKIDDRGKKQRKVYQQQNALINRTLYPFYILIERVKYQGNPKVDDAVLSILTEYYKQYSDQYKGGVK